MSKGRRQTPLLLLLAICATTLLMGAKNQGCGEGLDNRAGEPGIEVGGPSGALWDLQYKKTMDVLVKRGGVAISNHTVTIGAGGSFDLDGIKVDMDAYCARQDVVCPYDVFPEVVKMTQPGSERHLLYIDYKPKGPLAALKSVRLLGNVDSDDDFSVFLGLSGAGKGVCGLLGFSYATGHIYSDAPKDPRAEVPRGDRLAGDIVTAYSGACVLLGSQGGAGAGLEVEFSIPFTGVRR